MSGRHGLRGYILQTLICLLESLEQPWDELQLEPSDNEEKADIKFTSGSKRKLIQVKSSVNAFSRATIEAYAQSLRQVDADERILTLLGPLTTDVNETFRDSVLSQHDVQVPAVRYPTVSELAALACTQLDKYLGRQGIGTVPHFAREMVTHSLASNMNELAPSGARVTRDVFDLKLREWLLRVYPKALTTSAEEVEWRRLNRVEEAKYDLRRSSCLEALRLVDLWIASSIPELGQYTDPFELGRMARECHSKLVVACDSAQLVNLFRKFMMSSNVDITEIAELRRLVRVELGFGQGEVDLDDCKGGAVWIATSGGSVSLSDEFKSRLATMRANEDTRRAATGKRG